MRINNFFHLQADIISAGKERSYELWVKLQTDEINAKSDYASSALAATNSLFGSDSRKRKNSYYLCSRCGKPKKGHICKATMTNAGGLSSASSTPSGNGLHGRQDDDDDDDDEEEDYKIDPDDPEYEDEEVPEDDDEYPLALI